MLSIDECWDFFETCPGVEASQLPLGADPESIRIAEEQIGVSFPDDLRTFLRRHDGSAPFFIVPFKLGEGEQRFVGLGEMLHFWRLMVHCGAEFEQEGEYGEQKGPVRRNYWNRRWVPLTNDDGGDFIFIDLDPCEAGTLGQVVDWWHEGGISTFLTTSLRVFLNEVVDELRAGVYRFERWPPAHWEWQCRCWTNTGVPLPGTKISTGSSRD